MNRKTFIAECTRFIAFAMRLWEKAAQQGIAALGSEAEDIDDELFKQGLRFVIDGVEPRHIDEIMSNRIAHERDKYTRLYKTIQKRAVLGIQAGETFRVLFAVLLSLPGLTPKEEDKIEDLVLFDD